MGAPPQKTRCLLEWWAHITWHYTYVWTTMYKSYLQAVIFLFWWDGCLPACLNSKHSNQRHSGHSEVGIFQSSLMSTSKFVLKRNNLSWYISFFMTLLNLSCVGQFYWPHFTPNRSLYVLETLINKGTFVCTLQDIEFFFFITKDI